jgi:epoxide hydrolase-like predicted phosphatase
MTIRAVVFDIGGVLAECEPMDFGRRAEAEHGLAPGSLGAELEEVWTAGAIGAITEADVRAALLTRSGLTADQVDALLAEMWRQYLGVANTELIEWARALRPAYRTGILSNSFVGAREREQAMFGFDDLVDDLVYSHEVGVSKPDPAIWELTARRLAVEPSEIAFIDDHRPNVESARAFGFSAVLFENTAQAIADLEDLLDRSSPAKDIDRWPGAV